MRNRRLWKQAVVKTPRRTKRRLNTRAHLKKERAIKAEQFQQRIKRRR